MSVYKQFLTSDLSVSPFEVNKSFIFTPGTSSEQFAYLGYTSSISGEIINKDAIGINRFLGKNGNYFLSISSHVFCSNLLSLCNLLFPRN